MRVVILADPLDNQHAGIHVYTREMVNSLIRNNPGHEIILIRERNDPELYNVRQLTVPNIRLPIGFATLRLFLIVPFLIHRIKADVVIEPAHFGPFNLSKKIRRITIIHDLTPILFPQWHRWHSQMLQRTFLKRILKKADTIVTNSDHTSSDICKVYPDQCDKLNMIYPGISEVYKPEDNISIPEKYGITKPYFLNVGTIEPRKNLVELLEAFNILCNKQGTDIQLVIAGSHGWKYEEFAEALNKHPYRNSIIVTGFVPTSELPFLYTHCIGLVYPSMYEGFGLPVVEAMRCGSAVITSGISSLPEAGGDAALYYEPGDTNKLADLMISLSGDLDKRKELEDRSIKHAESFNWNKYGKDLWKVITKTYDLKN